MKRGKQGYRWVVRVKRWGRAIQAWWQSADAVLAMLVGMLSMVGMLWVYQIWR